MPIDTYFLLLTCNNFDIQKRYFYKDQIITLLQYTLILPGDHSWGPHLENPLPRWADSSVVWAEPGQCGTQRWDHPGETAGVWQGPVLWTEVANKLLMLTHSGLHNMSSFSPHQMSHCSLWLKFFQYINIQCLFFKIIKYIHVLIFCIVSWNWLDPSRWNQL